MRQISPVPRQKAKAGLIVFCVLALVVLLIVWKQEVRLEKQPQQSSQPEPSPQPQQPPESPEPPKPRQSSQPPRSRQPQQSPEPQQVPEPQSQEPQQPHARAVTEVRDMATLLEDYKSLNGAYPTTGQGLESVGAQRKDPWGSNYIYQSPSTRGRESYDLFSAGPDGQPDTPDDDWGETENPGE
jgi:outer membrane biosynthesis protein TonB